MPDNPMVGYAYRYVAALQAEACADRVKAWAFVHWATPAFDGTGSCVRYEVRLVLPIMDGGHVFRHLRWAPRHRWSDLTSLQLRVANKPVKRVPSWEETVGRQLSDLRKAGYDL